MIASSWKAIRANWPPIPSAQFNIREVLMRTLLDSSRSAGQLHRTKGTATGGFSQTAAGVGDARATAAKATTSEACKRGTSALGSGSQRLYPTSMYPVGYGC